MSRLSAISAAIANGLPRRTVFERVVEAVQRLGFDRVWLDLISEDGSLMERVAARGFEGKSVPEKALPQEDEELAKLWAEPIPQILNGGCADPKGCAVERGCLPILVCHQVIGKLCVDNANSGQPLDPEQLQTVFPFAYQVALAQAILPGNAKLWAESLERLRRTTLAITSARGRDALLQSIIEESVELLKAKSGGVYEYQPEREELELIAHYNRPEYVGKTLTKGEGLAGRLIQCNEPYMTEEDYNNWSGQAPIYAGKRLFGSVLEVPLRWEGSNIGVLYVDDKVGRKFSETDIRLLRLFADQAAISLVSSTLLDQDGQKLKRLERLAQATREMMGNLDAISLPERLAMIANHAAEILEAETSGVFLVRDGKLVLEASFGQLEEFDPGKLSPLKIHNEPGGGLAGYIAYEGKPFKDHGEGLKRHQAVAHFSPHTPSGYCYSLLAIPLKKRVGQREELVGLLRADNKKGRNDEALATLGFSQEDEWILSIFAEAAVVAIESAELVSQLKEQGDFRQRLISSSPDGIIAIDREGRVTEFNKRAEEILGYQRDEILGQPVAPFFFDPDEPRQVIGRMLHEEPDHHVRDHETFVRSKTGEKIPIRHASTWLLDATGERVGSVGYFEDLRVQKALERRESLLLKASNVLTEADELDKGLQRLVEMMVSELGYSFSSILLTDEDDRAMTLRAEYLSGNANWTPLRQQIVLADWDGLEPRLKAGSPWELKWDDPEVRPILERLASLLGFGKEIEILLVVPLKIGDRVLGQLDLGNLQGEGRPGFSIDLISALAAQIAVVIQRSQLLETTVRREKLLKALVQASPHIQPGAAIPELQQVIVRLAAELVGCQVGGLFLNRPYLGQLELVAVYGAPPDLVGEQLPHEDELIGQVAQEGETSIYFDPQGEIFQGLSLKVVAVVPFRRGSGEVEAVLFVGDSDRRDPFSRIDLEILDAFATQAAIALETARLMDREQLYGRQLATLRRISDYIQGADTLEKILHSVLTGITASYGLGFNRAVLMLIDEDGESLVGKMGIGELEDEKARAVWREDTAGGLNDFERYLKRLEKGEIELTTVGKQARVLRLPIRGSGVFSEVVESGKLQHVPIEQPDRIPERFVKLFRVRTPLVVAPLVDKGQVIGVLAVDNKFTQAPVGDDLCNALMAFASTAAVTIENKRLFDQTRSGTEKLLSFYKMGSELIALQKPLKILEKICEQTAAAAGASWVSILLIDSWGRAFNPIQTGRPFSMDPGNILPIRKDGISMEVMRTGQAFRIENVEKMRDRINNELMERSVQAAICLPLSLLGKQIGVMWIHYKKPHRFPDSEVAALQLYVNQAAIAYEGARQLEKLESLRSTSVALAEVDDMRSVLERIVRGAQHVLKANEALLWLYDAKTDHFLPESSVYWGEYPEAWSYLQKNGPQERGTAFRVMERGWMCAEEIRDGDQNRDVGPTTRQFLKVIGGRGFQGVALKVGREKLGVLYAIYAKPFRFAEEEKETALTFANHAALALKKAKLLDQVQRARETAEVLARVTLLEDPKHALLSIAIEIREALDCGAVVLFRYDEEAGSLILPAATAVTGVLPWGDERDAIDFALVLEMLEHDSPYLVPDVMHDERFRGSPFSQAQDIKSCAVIPLKAAGRKVGVMFINYRNPRRFTDDELINMELFANQAAVAIRNTQLFEESATKLEQQETLAALSRELLLANSLQDTMDRAVDFAARVLDTEFSSIVLPDREGRLLFSAAVGWERELVGKLILERSRSQTGYTIRKRAPVAVYDYSAVTEFKVPEIIIEHGINSGLSVPMFREGNIVGAMLVHTTHPRRFTEDDENLLSLIANHTVIAIERGVQYEASLRKSSYLTALYEASKALAAQFGPERRQILEQITHLAVQGIFGAQDRKAVWGTLELYDQEKDELILESVFPPKLYHDVLRRIGERRSLKAVSGRGKRIGITGRVVLSGAPLISMDIKKNGDYIEYFPDTLSEVAVPLIDRDQGQIIGVLNAESDRLYAFDEEDREALQALADLAVVALQNARKAEELKEAMAAQTALAWMGIGNANLRHEVRGHLGMIRNEIYLLGKKLEEIAAIPTLLTHLESMKELAEDLSAKIKTLSEGDEDGDQISSVRINESLILNRKRQVKGGELKNVPLDLRCGLDNNATVRANAYWLNRAIDILVHNSVEATEEQDEREVILGSRKSGDWAEIYVEDNGKGVPEDLLPRLFRVRVQHPGSQGLGVGLLMANVMVQAYGGQIRCARRNPSGTSMIISLPLEGGGHYEAENFARG